MLPQMERLYFNLFDDALISMRYAWNFAHGNGLVWNKGEYVEGYTNLLMTLLMAIASFFLEKRYAVLAIQLTGIVFVLGTAFCTVQILNLLKPAKAPQYILFVTILLYYPLNYWSLLGMETGLLAFLLSAGVLYSLLYAENLITKHLWLMVLCFGLAYLTRNNSLLFAALTFLYLTLTLQSLGKKYIELFLASGLTYGLFPIGQTLFRYWYYGQIVPNTYTLKLVGLALDERLKMVGDLFNPLKRIKSWFWSSPRWDYSLNRPNKNFISSAFFSFPFLIKSTWAATRGPTGASWLLPCHSFLYYLFPLAKKY